MNLYWIHRLAVTVILSMTVGVAGCTQAGEVPSSPRSQDVAKRIIPKLEAKLRGKGLTLGDPVFMRIFKESRELEIWIQAKDSKFELLQIYPIHHYSGELGPKLKKGDRQAPEGFYYVTPRRMNPNSRFHLSFNLGYPNTYDQAHGRTGSYLMVHGGRASIGCFAMTDARIEEIYTIADLALRNGQKYFRVHIFPFRMTPGNLGRHRQSQWYPFWQNLQEGYDWFEESKVPPDTTVDGGRYVFGK